MIVHGLTIPFYKNHIKPIVKPRGKDHKTVFIEDEKMLFPYLQQRGSFTIYTKGFIPEVHEPFRFAVDTQNFKVAVLGNKTIVDINNFGCQEFNLHPVEVFQYIKELCKDDISYPISVADLSAKIFRKRFLKYWITLFYPKESLKAYHGGKLLLYTKQKRFNKVYYADIKQAYGSIMKTLPSFYDNKLFKETKKIYDLGIYQISCECEELKYPYIFDENFKFQKQLIKQWVNGSELKNAIKLNLINNLTIHKGYFYDRKLDKNISPFKQFVNSFSKTKNPLKRRINKLIINSLYGKLIQSKKDIYYDTQNKETIFNFEGSGLFNPFIAGYITSSIRKRILEYEIKYNSLHTLIDAIICTKKPINQNKKAGQLINKISGSCEIKKAGVYLIKNYRAKKIGKMGLTENPFPSEDK